MVDDLKQLAIGAALGLGIPLVALPVLSLFVDSGASLVAKSVLMLLVPGFFAAVALFKGANDLVFYSALGVFQVAYWYLIYALWVRWRRRGHS